MERLYLEEKLEKGLPLIGIKLNDRFYYEDFYTASDIDDIKKKDKKKPVDNIDKLLRIVFFDGSRYQREVEQENVPFFERVSDTINGCFIEYRVYSLEEHNSYRIHADRIIKEDKIYSEYITIHPEKKFNCYFVMLNMVQGEDRPFIEVDINKKTYDAFIKDKKLRKSKVDIEEFLDFEKNFDKDEIYKKVIKFLTDLY